VVDQGVADVPPLGFNFGARPYLAAVQVARILAILTLLLGVSVLCGWLANITWLKNIGQMKPDAAVCFILDGVALLLGYLVPHAPLRKIAADCLAAGAILIAIPVFVEFGTSMENSNIQMAPLAAFNFCLFSGALLLLSRGPRAIATAHILTITGLFVSLFVFVYYLFKAQIFLSFVTPLLMSLTCVVGFAYLGAAILCARPRKGFVALVLADSPGGFVARRLIAPAALAPLFFGWIAVQGVSQKLYDGCFAAGFIVISSMVVICIMTTRAVIELNRVDIERKRLSQARLRADAREVGAVEASRLKSEFVANVSHELRTPMNGVLGMTSLLLDSDLTPEQREHVETIRQSGDALLTLVNEILDFSKIEAGKIVLEQKPFSLANCVDEVINLLALNARRNGIDLISFIEPHVLPSYLGDTSRVRQILLNLIGNAVKFTEKGEVTLQVSSSPVSDNVYRLEFLVSDTGPGISPEALGKLFQPFQQGDASATRKHGGTGLGLTITKRLVELMGGEITVSSTVGVGSAFRFTICLPACPMEGLVPEDRLPATCRLVIVARQGTYPVLLKRQLEAWGAKVLGVVDPLTLVKMTETNITAVLMDRDEDTIALAAQTQFDADWNRVPRILLDFDEPLTEDRAALFAKRLTKPVKRSHLLALLTEISGGTPSAPRATGPIGLKPMSDAIPLRILLAEDNHINQKVGLALLSRMGYRADVAGNGLEAVESVLRQPYDVVLMDIQMPEMDGLEAATALRRRLGDKCPVLVALTANAFQGARDQYLAQGFDDYLSKPILPPALRQLITRVGKALANRHPAAA
jgi:signal transduction histidine kinase/CheY-like chemotaxis protein